MLFLPGWVFALFVGVHNLSTSSRPPSRDHKHRYPIFLEAGAANRSDHAHLWLWVRLGGRDTSQIITVAMLPSPLPTAARGRGEETAQLPIQFSKSSRGSAISPRVFRARPVIVAALGIERAWERRAPNAPATTYAQQNNNGRSLHEYTETTRRSARNGFTAASCSPRCAGLFGHRRPANMAKSAPGRADFASEGLDISVGMSGPHDLAVRSDPSSPKASRG